MVHKANIQKMLHKNQTFIPKALDLEQALMSIFKV